MRQARPSRVVVRAGPLVSTLALVVALTGCAVGTSTVTTAAAAPFDDCGPVVEPAPTKGVEPSPGPVMTHEQAVAAVDRAHRRDREAAAASTAEGRDASRLPQVEHPGSLGGPEARTLDAAVRAADATSGQVSAVPRSHPFADEVVGLAEGELLARLRAAAGP